jgi:hypothetical protein
MAKKSPPVEVTEFFRAIGRKFGASGGKAAAENMTAQERIARAKKASAAAKRTMTKKERIERAQKAAAARYGKRRKR